MLVCPLCNGMTDYVKYCPRCGAQMEIYDRTEGYDDSYAPYLSYQLTDLNDGDPPGICAHETLCPVCGMRDSIHIKSIIM